MTADGKAPELIRLVGAAGSGRTSVAIRRATDLLATDERRLLVIDSLGHGASDALQASVIADRTVFKTETSAPLVLAISRHLIASAGIGCVIIDDLPGLDFGAGGDSLSRGKAIAIFAQSVAGIAVAFGTSVILVDRASEFSARPPLGFRDLVVSRLLAA
ncbi:MAG: hypothetical protein DI537_05380 [Stutzerimonas stutzeri]|nr:MAG: hypothetical protein DI537_05380 [Stutzerimonas stutzeri]